MTLAAVLSPMFVLIALSFFLGFWMGRERMKAVRAGLVGEEAALYPARWPERAQKVANSFHNQLELPIIFYVLVILAIVTHKADLLFVAMSWLFVASRLVHAFVHTTSNAITWRGGSFGVGVFTLLAMWIIFAIRILFS